MFNTLNIFIRFQTNLMFKSPDPEFFFLRIRAFTPKWPPKYILWNIFEKEKNFKNDSKIFFALSPSSADWISSVALAFSALLCAPLGFF